ncbi:30S ribosomal protein S2 [Spiroplasma endosymbiont of Anurida maritima]|uniref:30S ribosomal protein S2 n=1 Tax=Spiroplasma endosymbiont of Anurida maritima TaxID=2967972 RepID=UPI0036D2DE18
MSKEITREMLWEAGVQFGHQTKRWNPKMKEYIYGVKNKVHIIDLQQTLSILENLKKFMQGLTNKKGKILFVGTKKQAKWIIKDAAERSQNFYVNERWLGGTLTNLKTIQSRIRELWNIERREKSGELALLTKKEQMLILQKKAKLEKTLGGIKGMKDLPAALFVVDPIEDNIAVREANKLNIPVIAICDTNADPDNIDIVIPGNDDTSRAIAMVTHHIADLYGEAFNLKMPEAQFKPMERTNQPYEKRYNRDDNKTFVKKTFVINKPEGTKSTDEAKKPVEAKPVVAKKEVEAKPAAKTAATTKTAAVKKPAAAKKEVEAKPAAKTANNGEIALVVVKDDLQASLKAIKVGEVEAIAKQFKIAKAKKQDMIDQLVNLLVIKNGKVFAK